MSSKAETVGLEGVYGTDSVQKSNSTPRKPVHLEKVGCFLTWLAVSVSGRPDGKCAPGRLLDNPTRW